MAVLALYAIGSAIGGAIGGTFLGVTAAAWGGAIASAIGGQLLAPTQKIEGPRLIDLKAPQVAYGSVIPYVEGHPRLAGTIVWASEKREVRTTTEQGGKGGGGAEVTTFTYEQDILIMLAENELGAIRRIWKQGELIWTRADDGDIDSLDVSAESELWDRITFYSGAAAQMPDPVYEAAVTTALAPAYRTRSTVFIESLQLGSSGQLPALTIEVVPGGPDGIVTQTAKLLWEVNATDTYTGATPEGAYVGGADLAVAQSVIDGGVVTRVYDPASDSTIAAPAGASIVAPATGNSDRPVVGFGPALGYPAFYLAGDGLAITCNWPVNDYIGNGDIRYSFWGGMLAVASSLALGVGTSAYSGSPGHLGNVYIFNDAGVHQATIAHGAPVPSLAITEGGVYVLGTSNIKFYQAADWTLADTIGLPTGTGRRIFTSLEGVLSCANAAGDVFTWVEGAWELVLNLAYEDADGVIDLGTAGAHHFVSDGKAYAARVKDEVGAYVMSRRWVSSIYIGDMVGNSGYFFEQLQQAIIQHAQWFVGSMTVPGGTRATRGLSWTITLNEVASISAPPYVFIRHVHVVGSVDRYWGYTPGDLPPYGWGTPGSTVGFDIDLYQFDYAAAPEHFRTLEVYRGVTLSLVPLSEPTLQEVVERQCERAGLDLAYVDASALAARNVHSMALTQLTSPRQAIDVLSMAYLFSSVESELLRFSFRGGASAASIGYDELVAEGDAEPLPITKLNDLEVPVQVFVKYSNLYDDYQDGNESSDRLISSGQNTTQAELPLGFTPQAAKRIADAQVTDAAASVLRFGPFSLTRDYAHLEPSDVVTLEDSGGNTFRVRLVKKSESGGVLTFEGVSDDASVIDSTAVTSAGGYVNSTGVKLPIDTELELLDIPLLQDADDNVGFYVAVKPATDASFPGAVLFKSADDASFETIMSCPDEAVTGTASTTLGSGPAGVFDEKNSLTVDVGFGELASVTRDVLLNSASNALLVGSEIIQFRDAALVSAGVYTLSGLLRGQKGTEWAVGAHVAGERVVLLNTALRRVPMSNSELGVSKYWKAVSIGRAGSTAASETFTDNAVGKKPYAPVDLRFARDTGGNVTITLQRRTRLATRLIGALGVSCPLGEDSESYEVDIYASSGYATVKRTLTASTPSLTYSAANQVTDFGTAQATLYAKAYQLSAAVGRGYAATAQG